MTAQLLLATRNAAKLAELRRILTGVDVELLGLGDVPAYDEVPETGLTFADNALLKAREAVAQVGLPAVADDSGLVVAVLGGMPGVLSARWAGRHGADAANLQLVLDQTSDIADGHRDAAFVCAAALVTPAGHEHLVEGRIDGTLERAARGTGGFGYDPIFCPTGEKQTTAEMSPAEKDAISHRGKAFRALVPIIAAELAAAG